MLALADTWKEAWGIAVLRLWPPAGERKQELQLGLILQMNVFWFPKFSNLPLLSLSFFFSLHPHCMLLLPLEWRS